MIKRHIIETIEEYNEEGILTNRTTTKTDEVDEDANAIYVGTLNAPDTFDIDAFLDELEARLPAMLARSV